MLSWPPARMQCKNRVHLNILDQYAEQDEAVPFLPSGCGSCLEKRRRRFITREHTSDTSEVDALAVKTPEEECDQRRLENISLPSDTPSAFVRVKPSTKSATLERTFRESKNGLALPSSRLLPLPPLVPVSSEPNPQCHLASENIVQQPLIYTPLQTSTGFLPECDSLSLGFRPIRRDSLGSTSSSLAGSELTISNAPPNQIDSPQKVVKPPPHPACKDPTDSVSKLRPWSYYEGGMLMPRTVLSSAGSASSYDNLDKTDFLAQQKNALQFNSDTAQIRPPPSPRFSHMKQFESNPKRSPSPPPVGRHSSPFRADEDRQFYVVGSRMHGYKSGDASKESLTMTGEDKGESAHFLEGVCRRRMAGGHVQVIPPHLVGVFDPSRFIPTNIHAPTETAATSFIAGIPDTEATKNLSLTKKPESAAYHTVGKLSSESSAQPGFTRPSESSAKSFLPHIARQQANKDMNDHSLNIHTNPTLPFASKDSGLRTGEKLANTLLPKVPASCKSYKNAGDSLARDAGSKSSDKHLLTAGRKAGSNISSQEQELSSVTDLFHHVVPNAGSSQLGGPVFHNATGHPATQKPQEIQMPSVKTSSFSAANHSSPSKQGSPKYVQTPAQKNTPKLDSLPLSKDSQKYEQISLHNASLHKISPKQDQTSAAKDSPKWERMSAAKTSSPKSSPKQERTSAAKCNRKWEVPDTVIAKAGQQSSCPRSVSNWEPTLASKENTRSRAPSLTSSTSDKVIASFSASGYLEKEESLETAHIMGKAGHNEAVSGAGKIQLQPVSTDDSIRRHETPAVSNDCGQPRLRTDRDKRKTISTQLQTIGASDSVFSARRKQFSSPLSPNHSADKANRQNRTGADIRVESAPKSAAAARQNVVNQVETVTNFELISEASTAPSDKANLDSMRNSVLPRKASEDTICYSDAASDKTATSNTSSSSSSLNSIEKRRAAEQQKCRNSESGESDVHSARSAAEDTETVKVPLSQVALQEETVVDVSVTESGLAAAAGTYSGEANQNLNDAGKSVEDATVSCGEANQSLNDAGKVVEDATVSCSEANQNLNDAGKLVEDATFSCSEANQNLNDAGKSVEDATVSGSKNSIVVAAKVSANEKEIRASLMDIADNSTFEVALPKIELPTIGLQTKTFTDILESIQVVTQPCGTHNASSSQDTSGTTLVSHPSLSCSVPFFLFDLHDESVIKSSQSTFPVETFNEVALEVNEQAKGTRADQHVAVVEIVPRVEKSTGYCSDELAKVKIEQNADVMNNNSKAAVPSLQSICFKQSQNNSSIRDCRSLDLHSSLSLGELPAVGLSVDETPSMLIMTATESDQTTTGAKELSYPNMVEKAIFTVDKEISFVSRLLEPDNRNSLPWKVSSHMPTCVQSTGQVEYLPMEPEYLSNMKLLTESAPVCSATVSPMVTSRADTSLQNHSTKDPVDKMPSAFQNLYLSNVQDFPTLLSISHLKSTQVDPSFTWQKNSLSSSIRQIVLDSPPLISSVNPTEAGSLVNESYSDKKDKVISDLDESYETVDQGGTDSKVSTASLDQITQEKEIFELVKTSGAYIKPEIASASFATFLVPSVKTQEMQILPAGKTEPLGTSSVPKPRLIQNHESAKCEFVFPSKESLSVNASETFAEYQGFDKHPNASPSKSEVSSVMAALDDALAVLTSVVMENKNTGSDTLRRTTASAVKLNNDVLQPNMEKVISNLNTDTRKPAKSKCTNREGLSLSKKKTCGSHAFDGFPVSTAPSHHSDPLEVTDIVRQEIQTVEKRRHQLMKEDSFNRPDSPMFHETLPLPKDSVIKRNREHCRDSSSSSDCEGSPELAPRSLRRGKRCQDANKSASVTTPSEISGYRPFVGAHSAGLKLSRHESDIVLDVHSLTGTSFPSSQHLHKSRRHNSDSADAGRNPWPKTVSLAQGMDVVTAEPGRDAKRRADRFALPSDIQQSLLLYNQQHGGRRGQSWMQTVDASVKGTFTGAVHSKDKAG